MSINLFFKFDELAQIHEFVCIKLPNFFKFDCEQTLHPPALWEAFGSRLADARQSAWICANLLWIGANSANLLGFASVDWLTRAKMVTHLFPCGAIIITAMT
jgi:hypothetical protein